MKSERSERQRGRPVLAEERSDGGRKTPSATPDFIIVAFAVFMMIRALNRLKKKEETVTGQPPAPSREEILLTEIRVLLKETQKPA